jgi:hypothetical protein
MVIGASQFLTTGLMLLTIIGARKTVPSSIARIVALGLFHISWREYSSTLCLFGVIVAHFTATPYPSLIRESIQNSLDVVYDVSKPVRMKFSFGRISPRQFTSFYDLRSHIQGVIDLYKDKAIPQYLDMLECFEGSYSHQLEYIKVSDYNTKGMHYVPNDSPFHAFVRALGLTVKDEESSGGPFGFGKAAYFMMSPIHTVRISTKTCEGRIFFEGAASLCTHLMSDETGKKVKCQHYGYYDNQGGTQPISSPNDIPAKFRRE